MTASGGAPTPQPGPTAETRSVPPRNARPEALPHARPELTAALRNPLRLVELALADRPRLLATVSAGEHAALLAAALLLGGLFFALPFGLVLGLRSALDAALLFEGSLLLCFPSLHMFGAFCGWRTDARQTLAIVAWAACVAALFALGFAPIQWFLACTMQNGDRIGPAAMAIVLLLVSLVFGVATLVHGASQAARAQAGVVGVLLVFWIPLLGLMVQRMARLLGLV